MNYSLGYTKSIEGEALATGQCKHLYLWKNGHTRQGKPRVKCSVCYKSWGINTRERLNKFDRAARILPYVKLGWSADRIAKELKISYCTVYRARKLLKSYMDTPTIKRWPYHKRSYKENCAFILEHLNLSNKELAKELNLSYVQTVWYRKQLGLTNQKFNRYKAKVMVAGNGS